MPSCSANGSATEYYYALEVDGAVPSDAEWKPIRFVTSSLSRQTTQIDSNEISKTRQRPVSRQGTYRTQGEIMGELSYGTYDELLALAMQSDWSADVLKIGELNRSFAILERHTDITNATITATTISAAAADDSFNDSGNGFVAAGFKVGQMIVVSGFTGDVANNRTYKIATVAAGKITVTLPDGSAAANIVDDAAAESVTILSAVDFLYQGCRLNGFTIASAIDTQVKITFPVLGTDADVYAVPLTHTFAAATTSNVMVTSEGELQEGGAVFADATAFDFSLNNGMQHTFALFRRAAYCVSNGVAVVSGTLSAYLKNGTLYGKQLNETPTSFEVTFTDGTNGYTIEFPDGILTQANKGVSGPNAIIPQYTFSAGYDAGAASTLVITR